MPTKVDVNESRRKFNRSLELATQKNKIREQKEEIAKLKRSIKAREEAIIFYREQVKRLKA